MTTFFKKLNSNATLLMIVFFVFSVFCIMFSWLMISRGASLAAAQGTLLPDTGDTTGVTMLHLGESLIYAGYVCLFLMLCFCVIATRNYIKQRNERNKTLDYKSR